MKIGYICVAMLWASTTWSYTVSGNTYVTNGSQSDVQAACNAAPDNGTVTVQIPNGTYGWAGTLNITRAISLAGESAKGVVIQNNNATASMIRATSGLNGNINIYWLNIQQIANNNSGSSSGKAFALECDRSQPTNYTVLVHDCSFNQGRIYNYSVLVDDNGVILWNDTFVGSGNLGLGGISFVAFKYGYAGWNTPDTLGAADTTSLNNSYVEGCSFSNAANMANFQDNSRVVWRYNTHQDCGLGSHGQETGVYGVKHWEIYNCTFNISPNNPMSLNYWFQIRGGTGVITGNSIEDIPLGKTGFQLNVFSITRGMNDGAGGEFCPLAYPAPRQTGWGWSASSTAYWGIGDDTMPSRLVGGTSPGPFAPDGQGAILDPIYIWGNSGAETTDPNYVGTQTYEPDNCGNGKVISTYLQQDRDYYVNVASPTWAPYTYPHPLHTAYAVASGSQTSTPTSTPTPTPTPTATSTPAPTATPVSYSTWKNGLYNKMRSRRIGRAKITQVETWMQINPPASSGGSYFAWENELYKEMESVGIGQSSIRRVEIWVFFNSPRPN